MNLEITKLTDDFEEKKLQAKAQEISCVCMVYRSRRSGGEGAVNGDQE